MNWVNEKWRTEKHIKCIGKKKRDNGTSDSETLSVPEPFQLLGNCEHVLAKAIGRTSVCRARYDK